MKNDYYNAFVISIMLMAVTYHTKKTDHSRFQTHTLTVHEVWSELLIIGDGTRVIHVYYACM